MTKTHPLSKRETSTLYRDLLAWYAEHGRTLPWRARAGEPSDPYRVLVSELMLQQTTVATVTKRFAPFMARFPTLSALAAAPLDDVLHAWQGLGYYRRARGLHACAQTVVERHGGRLPEAPAALEALPSIGPYTAAAVAAIAFDHPVLAVDANVERVLARLFAVETPLPQARAELRRRAAGLTPNERPGDSVQALMDLGASVCRPQRPACTACPLRAHCAAFRLGLADHLPAKAARGARPNRFAVAFYLVRPDGAVLFRRRPPTGLLAGLAELPSTAWTEAPPMATEIAGSAPADCRWEAVPGRVRHVFTHLVLDIELRRGELRGTTPLLEPAPLWCAPQAFDTLALPTLTRKLLAQVAGGA